MTLNQASVSLDDAQRVVAAGRAKADEMSSPSNIAVVDVGGNLVTHIRMDGAWILRQIQTHHADSAGELHCPHEIVEYHRGIFMALRIMCLITDTVATAVGASAFGLFEDLLDSRSL